MASDNNEGKLNKTCPFLNKDCDIETCAIVVNITQEQMVLGIKSVRQIKVCAFVAACMIASSRAQQMPMPMPIKFNQPLKG